MVTSCPRLHACLIAGFSDGGAADAQSNGHFDVTSPFKMDDVSSLCIHDGACSTIK